MSSSQLKRFTKVNTKSRALSGLVKKKSVNQTSRQTNKKVELCKKFMREHYLNVFSYLSEREKRIQNLREGMKQNKVSFWQKKKKTKEHFSKETHFLRNRRSKLSMENFKVIAKIGQGGFSDVFLCERPEFQEFIAMKRLKKDKLSTIDEIEHINNEREVMIKHNSDWLAKLFYSFQDTDYLYLGMEFLQGGDFKTLLNHLKFLDEEVAKLYFSEMVLAVEDLHKLGFIHRDLKPENFLIDSKGHIKLTDFGLSKKIDEVSENDPLPMAEKLEKSKKTSIPSLSELLKEESFFSIPCSKRLNSVAGSPEYVAPEILTRKKYSKEVDFWSLGCLLYEMLSGTTPFVGRTKEETLENVIHFKKTLHFPTYSDGEEPMSKEAWDLITKLLAPKAKRLGKSCISEIKEHPFFDGIDWKNLRNVEPPFVPKILNQKDISYFDTTYFEKTSLEISNHSVFHYLENPLKHVLSFNYSRIQLFEKENGNKEKV
ncbi:cell cycle protein kinase dbf2-related [Anaeramoeba ignava]|uniref:non-specific serine/threonine protein kinase n=1 Tax=Anaeramoeba ignava TaxID=1746090 RepID=A0A9Q0RHG0_ANAIG|nr:cell cycle protein kinase dbf2-related [Anaeramoeba ignava]